MSISDNDDYLRSWKEHVHAMGENPMVDERPTQIMVDGTQITPVNLRTEVYRDAKKLVRILGKFILAGLVLYMLYHYFGWFGFVSFVIFFVPCYFIVIPKIAEKFMSYDSFVSVGLTKTGQNYIAAVQIPVPRAQQIYFHDADRQQSALNAPFQSLFGHSYVVDNMNLNAEILPGQFGDLIEVNPWHTNIDFVMSRKDVFLDLRADYVRLKRSYHALEALIDVKALEIADRDTMVRMDMVMEALFNVKPPIMDSDISEALTNVAVYMKQLGLDVNVNDPLGKGNHLVKGLVEGEFPGSESA